MLGKRSQQQGLFESDYHLCWKGALGKKVKERPFAKSTLQLFRSQVILNEKMRALLQRSLEITKCAGSGRKRWGN
jgi:hypothetical protein